MREFSRVAEVNRGQRHDGGCDRGEIEIEVRGKGNRTFNRPRVDTISRGTEWTLLLL